MRFSSDYYVQIGQFATAIATLLFVYGIDESQTFYVPESIEDARNLAAFHLYTLSIVALCVFTRGPNNKRIAIIFALAAMLENYIFAYLWYRSGISGVYLVSWFGIIANLPMYLVIKHNDVFSYQAFKVGAKIPVFKSFCIKQLNRMFPTKFELMAAKVVTYYLLVEVAYTLMNLGYGLMFGVPNTGSISKTIIENKHFDFYFVYRAMKDMVLAYFLVLVFRTLWDEVKKEPDYL